MLARHRRVRLRRCGLAGKTAVVRVRLHVRPGASRPFVGGSHGGALVVAVSERAVDGRATEAALRALAEALGVASRDVHLRSGARSREKVVVVDVSDEGRAVVEERLALLLEGRLEGA